MRQQEAQAARQERRMQEQQDRVEQQTNRARRSNQASAGAAVDGGSTAALDGPGSTLLTGSQGVDPDQLQLGRNTLLGG